MNAAKHSTWMRTLLPLAIVAVLAVTAVGNGTLAIWIALDAVPFVLFWMSAATLVVLVAKGRFRTLTAEDSARSAKLAFGLIFLAAAAVVVSYSCLVIAPVAMTPTGDQTGAGSVWVVASVIAAMIALPTMSLLLSPLFPNETEELPGLVEA